MNLQEVSPSYLLQNSGARSSKPSKATPYSYENARLNIARTRKAVGLISSRNPRQLSLDEDNRVTILVHCRTRKREMMVSGMAMIK